MRVSGSRLSQSGTFSRGCVEELCIKSSVSPTVEAWLSFSRPLHCVQLLL